MSYIITPFEVSSKSLPDRLKCRFIHLYAAIATRHSDTMDCVFRVDGQTVTVALSCAAISALKDRDHCLLHDQQLAEIAARFLRKTLEAGSDPTQAELFVGEAEIRALARDLGYL